MSLTPEQWRELDEAERAHAAHPLFGDEWADAGDAHARLAGGLVRHARTLIDAARPRCEKCEGVGKLSGEFVKRDGSRVQGWTCSVCNGTGWST